jgi:methylenetetrahydrofolate reductase (NADPH)
MTVIDKINAAKKPLFTFELLPPLKGHSLDRIYNTIDRLMKYEPAYINFTSHRNEVVFKERPDGLIEKKTVRKRPGTVALAAAVKYKYNVTVVPHLLCGGFTKQETENLLIDMNFLGINDLLALRGDPVKGRRAFIPEVDGHSYTSKLVAQISDMNRGNYLDDVDNTPTSFCVGVAGYPEKHIEAANMISDLERLKEKIDAGGKYIVTQMFFDNQKFYSFVEKVREMGIDVPVIPGLKPVAALNDINLLPQTFNIDMPDELVKELKKCKTNRDACEVGVEWTTQQSLDLLANNVPGIHYYTLGASDNISRIVKNSF